MKTKLLLLCFTTVAFLATGQGTFIYDQQSSDETNLQEGGAHIVSDPPVQSFTPGLSSIGFIRLFINDVTLGNGVGGTVYLNLLQNSVSGPVLASTQPVVLPDSSQGPVNFFFSIPISLNPGQQYYIQPLVQSGDDLQANISFRYNYSGGTAYLRGQPSQQGYDLWFREGIVVPEPASLCLLPLGAAFLLWLRRKNVR